MYAVYGLKDGYRDWEDEHREPVATFDSWQEAELFIAACSLKQKGTFGPFRSASPLSYYDDAEVDEFWYHVLPHNPEPDWFKKDSKGYLSWKKEKEQL